MSCCRRRHVQDTLRGVGQRSLAALVRAAGAAGGGWALLAAARAVSEALEGGEEKDRVSNEILERRRHQKAAPSGEGVPGHIAVIMDGNRRYGRGVNGDALAGHRAGGERLRDFAGWCADEGVKILTVFGFSTENWKRTPAEVQDMMELFLEEVPKLGENAIARGMRVRFLATDTERLPAELRTAMQGLERRTADGHGLQLNVCVSYGGRGDISQACQKLAREAVAGELDPDAIDEVAVAQRLLTGALPDPDLLIRTSGEQRLSNFLVFQLAYAEFVFLDRHWPEVTKDDFLDIIDKYKARQRRFGK